MSSLAHKKRTKKQDIDDLEMVFLDHEIKDMESKIFELQCQLVSAEEKVIIEHRLRDRLNQASIRHTGKEFKDLLHCAIPVQTFRVILEEGLGEDDDIIPISHRFYQYSIAKRRPEILEYEPKKPTGVTLTDILNNLHSCAATQDTEIDLIINQCTPEETKRARYGDLVYWEAWRCATNRSLDIPISEDDVCEFILQHLVKGLDHEVDLRLVKHGYKKKLGLLKISTIERRFASLSTFLTAVGWPNPCKSEKAKELLKSLKKKLGIGRSSGKAITKNILDDMLETCGDKLIDIRDKAILLFAWGSGGRRRDEVVKADIKDLVETPEGDYIYTIPKSKTDQFGEGSQVPVKGRCARALRDWLKTSQVKEGAIFRSINKAGEVGRALNGVDIHRIVRKRLKIAGYDETQYGAHSLRSGFVTESGRLGKPLGDVMQMTKHRNVNTAMRYYQAGSIINNSASNIAGL